MRNLTETPEARTERLARKAAAERARYARNKAVKEIAIGAEKITEETVTVTQEPAAPARPIPIQPEIGQYVRPNDTFYHRPLCKVVEVGRNDSRPYLGRYFIAEYPDGSRELQWDGDANARFDEVRDLPEPVEYEVVGDVQLSPEEDAEATRQIEQADSKHTPVMEKNAAGQWPPAGDGSPITDHAWIPGETPSWNARGWCGATRNGVKCGRGKKRHAQVDEGVCS